MRARLVPLAFSVAIHAALVGVVAVAASAVSPRTQIMVLELLQPETPPAPAPAPTVAPSPVRRPEPQKPARLIAAVRPVTSAPLRDAASEPQMARPVPAPPERPVVRAPAEAPPALEIMPPSPSPAPAITAPPALAPSVTPPAAPSGAPSPSASPMPSGMIATPVDGRPPSAPAVAAIPRDGATQRENPRPLLQPRVRYPAWAPRIEGTTLLKILVADDGRVSEVQVAQSAGHRALDDAAAATVKKWRFAPARRNGDPIAAWVEVPIQFTLR